MLGTALKIELVRLAADPREPLAARVRRQVGAREAARHIGPVRNLIMAAPEMGAQLCAWLDASEMPPKFWRLHRRVLARLYRLHPSRAGGKELFDYFEEAYLVGITYDVTLEHVEEALAQLLPGTEAFPRQIPRWLESAKRVFPSVAERIEREAAVA